MSDRNAVMKYARAGTGRIATAGRLSTGISSNSDPDLLTYTSPADLARPTWARHKVGDSVRRFGISAKKAPAAPPKSCMVFECVLTSDRQDRDGDVLLPDGADIDMRMPLLFNHISDIPVGKILSISERTPKIIKVFYAIADTPTGRDMAALVEFGAVRISHGFDPVEMEPLDQTGKTYGYLISKYKVLEGSLVPIPSNEDAVVLAYSRQKLHCPRVKGWAKGLYENRRPQAAGCGPLPAAGGKAVAQAPTTEEKKLADKKPAKGKKDDGKKGDEKPEAPKAPTSMTEMRDRLAALRENCPEEMRGEINAMCDAANMMVGKEMAGGEGEVEDEEDEWVETQEGEGKVEEGDGEEEKDGEVEEETDDDDDEDDKEDGVSDHAVTHGPKGSDTADDKAAELTAALACGAKASKRVLVELAKAIADTLAD